jgi:type I restriction enzyme M protein
MPLPSDFEKTLWDAADVLWANTGLQPSEYSDPILALLFLRFADARFTARDLELKAKPPRAGIEKHHYHEARVPYLQPKARYGYLVQLGEGDEIGNAIDHAMELIEEDNEDLKGVLYRGYNIFPSDILKGLLKTFYEKLNSVQGDVFGRVYEYFLGEFAKKNLQKGGEYFTPLSAVRLIVAILEPFQGRVFDPACGSGGMFVQSARFIEEHHKQATSAPAGASAPAEPSGQLTLNWQNQKAASALSIYGVEKVQKTQRLCRMNLAIHGLSGDIMEANSYYEDPHEAVGKFDFVMANPPFNQNAVNRQKVKEQPARFPWGPPSTDNANYLWVQLFHSSLSDRGRAGFVMANSASDARGSDLEMRKKLIESGVVDVIVSLSSNLFYTVTLPATLWFLDRGKPKDRQDQVLFIDARNTFRQVDRAHREITEEQVEFLANIARLVRGKPIEALHGGGELTRQHFPDGTYCDVPGLCKFASRKEIEAQGWSLNPGRYVGVTAQAADDFDFKIRLGELNEELETLNAEAHALEAKIAENIAALLA